MSNFWGAVHLRRDLPRFSSIFVLDVFMIAILAQKNVPLNYKYSYICINPMKSYYNMDKVYKINENTPFRYVTDYFKYYRLEDGTHILYQSLFIEEFPDSTDYETINNYIYEELAPECEGIVDCGDYWEVQHILDMEIDDQTREIAREILTNAEENL